RDEALLTGREAVACADRSDDPFDASMSRVALAGAVCGSADVDELARIADELVAMGSADRDEHPLIQGQRLPAQAGLMRGDADGYAATLTDTERRCRASGNTWGVGTSMWGRFTEAAARGRFAEAEAVTLEVLSLAANDANFATVYAGQTIILRQL